MSREGVGDDVRLGAQAVVPVRRFRDFSGQHLPALEKPDVSRRRPKARHSGDLGQLRHSQGTHLQRGHCHFPPVETQRRRIRVRPLSALLRHFTPETEPDLFLDKI